jgi:hypothetical protein
MLQTSTKTAAILSTVSFLAHLIEPRPDNCLRSFYIRDNDDVEIGFFQLDNDHFINNTFIIHRRKCRSELQCSHVSNGSSSQNSHPFMIHGVRTQYQYQENLL